ncbi:AraC family transcriptional regulator [Sorangium cellulosum]|uniref:AraC family transcriptional regulator n=1 Tax=Sorangium cellulosum TaxID=56 RepID=A0A2L0F8U7_SORCE|nr:AraC family transcriptional regulator [Sorangium cellulosum]AUX48016.1 AraC family transcriptional regulator [Sorangium cellulosum]
MAKLQELSSLIMRHTAADGMHACKLPRVTLIRSSRPTMPMPALYTPSLCLVTQGRKQAVLAGHIYDYDAAKYLVVSVDLPVVGSVMEASPREPYLCLQLHLDMGMLGELVLEQSPPDRAAPPAGLSIHDVTPALVDACTRLVALLDTPEDIAALGHLVEREILYRLVTGSAAEMMRHIARSGGGLARVSRVIGWIKAHYAEPFTIKTLAAHAGMSESSLHAHFRSATMMSPLQFRAQLRLQEARRLMVAEGVEAAQAGFRVGYDSPSQFSREYRRLFGASPAMDAARLRASGGEAARSAGPVRSGLRQERAS